MVQSPRGRTGVLLAGLFLVLTLSLSAQVADQLSLGAEPAILVPLQPSTEFFTVGAGAELIGTYTFTRPSFLFLQAGVGINYLPTRASVPSYAVAFSGGAGLALRPVEFLRLSAAARGGYYLSVFQNTTGGSMQFSGHLAAEFSLGPRFNLGIGGLYRYLMDVPEPYFHGFGGSISLSMNLGDVRRQAIEFIEFQIDPVFASLHKFYDTNPFGFVRIANVTANTLSNVSVEFFVSGYMDQPVVCATIDQLREGEDRLVPITALFNESVLDLNEATLVTGVVTASYTALGESLSNVATASVRLHDPNALTWTDDNKAAAYVTTKDPAVLALSKSVAGRLDDLGSATVNQRMDKAMALFEALAVANLGYVPDPQTPYADFSRMESVVDYVQFPSETLSYGAGDCDDLSILYATLLESVGVEAAFITTPGHIFTAFSLGITGDESERTFQSAQDLIVVDGMAWVPVEVTLLDDGFIRAWSIGARQWRDAENGGTAGFFPVHDGWEFYESVNMESNVDLIRYPSVDETMERFGAERVRLVEREIQDRVSALESRIPNSRRPEREINALGVLYARFGLYDQAEDQFRRGLDIGDSALLINLANLLMIRDRYQEASEILTMVQDSDPDNRLALVCRARVEFELGNQAAAIEAYDRLATLDPGLADRYSYLVASTESGARAGLGSTLEETQWAEAE